ncbi:MAG: hypothetical protein ACRDQA_27240, partial [Nocardioidaceae bacterium]
AAVVPAILDHDGQPLSLGRKQRIITPAQRLALETRDKGCTMYSCDAPPSRCEGHHITPWVDDGPTDINGMCLGCTVHHPIFDSRDWKLQLTHGRIRIDPKPREPTTYTTRRRRQTRGAVSLVALPRCFL